MPKLNNIELFNDHVAQIFSWLYNSFPEPVILNMDSFTYGSEFDNDLDPAEYEGTRKHQYERLAHTMRWLAREGYVRYEGESLESEFGFVQLTEKGLITLRAVPQAISGKPSMGAQISKALSDGAKTTARKLAEEALQAGIKYGLTQLS